MIQINLLPPEYRPRTGTPVARLVAVLVGVALVASATGAYAYTHFIQLKNVKELRDVRAEEARSKEVQRDRSLALQREIDVYEKRRSAIQTINRSRTLWSRKLDQFFDIVTNQDSQDTFLVWLETIDVPAQQINARQRRPGRARKQDLNGGPMRFDGYLAMDTSPEAPALSSTFYRALTGDPDMTGERTEFFKDFVHINNPNVSVVRGAGRGQEKLLPPVVGSFHYELLLNPPVQPKAPGRRVPATPRRR